MRPLLSLIIFAFASSFFPASAETYDKPIRISTESTDLIFHVAPSGRLYQVYFGERLKNEDDAGLFDWHVRAASDGGVSVRGHEVYPVSGGEDFFEPALALTHADGNRTSYLYFKDLEIRDNKSNTETIISLADDVYPVEVRLHYVAYPHENVIKTWSEISHRESAPITLWKMGSTILHLDSGTYYLTNFSGDWAREGQPNTERLTPGKKVVDTKLGTRSAMYAEPFFIISYVSPAQERLGRSLLGTLGWTGNFSFTFEVDNMGALRVIPAINSYASDYTLEPGQVFVTPEFIFTLSNDGVGTAMRNLHDWARLHQIKDGEGPRLTLLNNWENTYFKFDEPRIKKLIGDSAGIGVDMFLLDDGWFGNKHPRNNDRAGLGDWQVNADKLPGGIDGLIQEAKDKNILFGLWIEPEMVNPASELYEKHRDWVIELPDRDTYYYRHQLVLDLANPEVQDYVFGVIDTILKDNPSLTYFKWDCNSPITNIYSPYLKEKQGNLYVDYVRGLYNILRRLQERYPHLSMMLCSGGGGRCDYEAMKYFTEFWASDDTDPFERLYIQWSLSTFFPAKAIAAHVTDWNKKTSLKFRTDVASMGKLGFDLNLADLSEDELQFCRNAVSNFKELSGTILDGDLFRLVSPFDTNHAAVNYVDKDRNTAVLFAFDLHPRYMEPLSKVRVEGLDADKTYLVEEINLMPGRQSESPYHGKTFSGDYLMKAGLNVFTPREGQSHVFRISAQ